MSSTVAEVFNQAWRHHQAGAFDQAERLYRQVLEVNPGNADAWCFLGASCHSQGRMAEAEKNLQQALQVLPYHPSAGNVLVVVLADQPRFAEAIAMVRQLLRKRK